MDELAVLRLALGQAASVRERARRDLLCAQVHADYFREPDGSFQVVDEVLNQQMFAEIQTLQPALDVATAVAQTAEDTFDTVARNYDALAAATPLFGSADAGPILLLPLRLEAVYRHNDAGAMQLRIRVYPDDIHIDTHEPTLTERERTAGSTYWRAVFTAEASPDTRSQAWRALVSVTGDHRAGWVRSVLTPINQPPGDPAFPDVDVQDAAWTRSAHTRLLPDRLEYSAYRDGALVWRHQGNDIPDSLPVGISPQAADDAADPDALGFDTPSRWLIDFDAAVATGMGLVVELDDPLDRYDLLTVVGVASHDAATGTARLQELLAAHSHGKGVSTLPMRTPTNNTPSSRSGWLSLGMPVEPDVTDARREAFDPAGAEDAARLARALGMDGRPVLAAVCDPAADEEDLLRRVHQMCADHYSWSPSWRSADDIRAEVTRCTEPWLVNGSRHFTDFVRARGPLPALRIGRQPYGVVPVSALDLWRGDDLDAALVRVVRAFRAAFAEHVGTALHVGEGVDQDSVLLDLLSREASPRQVLVHPDFTVEFKSGGSPTAVAIGGIPAGSAFAWLRDDGFIPEPTGAFPDVVSDEYVAANVDHLLGEYLTLFDAALTLMAQSRTAPTTEAFDEVYLAIRARQWQLPTHLPPEIANDPARWAQMSMFYDRASWTHNALFNTLAFSRDQPDGIDQSIAVGLALRELFADSVALEDEAMQNLPRLERLIREALETLSHRVDAWVVSLATARLSGVRATSPDGLRTGAYGMLTEVEPGDPNPQRQGFVLTPSLHHATTAAVLRSGWQAHSDKGAFAVDIQSARVRSAQTMIDGVRNGQTVNALLGYQFERTLHDARLDRFIAGFRVAFPLAPMVDSSVPDHDEVRVSIAARNVVDGQALRLARAGLDEIDDGKLRLAAGTDLGADAAALRRLIAELDETFDAVGDLVLAESVHHLVGGNALRAGLAADAAGRGQELPADYDVLRTPRSGVAVTHNVGLLFPDAQVPGWNDDRPLALLEPGLERWMRTRLGPAEGLAVGPGIASAGWCALDLVVASPRAVHAILAAAGDVDEVAFETLMLLCQRLRATVAGATPLSPTHLDPIIDRRATGVDLDEFAGRIQPWLADIRAAADELEAANTPEAVRRVTSRLGDLGLPIGGDGSDRDATIARLGAVPFTDPGTPPDVTTDPAAAEAWLSSTTDVIRGVLHPALVVVPRLTIPLPPAPMPVPEVNAVDQWVRDMTLVRPKVRAMEDALIAAEVLAATAASSWVVAQPVPGSGPDQWVAVGPPPEGNRPRSALVLAHDGERTGQSGLVVDSWTEVVPRSPGPHGPEEVAGVAFDFDRPGARAPQAMLIAVPPDPIRGWCMEDVHAIVEETLLLAKIRTLDLVDVPELRAVLPVRDGQ